MNKTKIGIIFGGASEEHPVSVKSAREIALNLDTEKYDPYWIRITNSGEWKLCDGPGQLGEEHFGHSIVLSPDRSVHGLLVEAQDCKETVHLDLVFPLLHGTLGEDGAIQGLLELAGIPYIGCDVQASAIAMDKSLTYIVAANAGVLTPNYEVVAAHAELVSSPFAYPVFVKPARSGSSFGVSKVTGADELASAVDTAREFDSKVLVEEAVSGSEIGCAVLGNDENLIVGEVDRVDLSGGFFRIHQEDSPETGSENSTFIVPADISEESRQLVQETAKTIYRALGCRGLARVDMFLTDDGHVVINEVNTMPGMTSYSRYPRMMAAFGLSLSDVIDQLASLALEWKRR
ncbi:D-alanine--(R)-lactate ligase [Brevibacterium sp. FME37]|uniref:D-alanine--(R)-lactate ligase n=1 Tax=Brevibacterium sp. FME37 TaxID=2742607 RepID=UPI0018669986|nr:D-alanine--(R)-lactate ligase [Brevibacterium sp. FME37]